jgi:hypothetical protein
MRNKKYLKDIFVNKYYFYILLHKLGITPDSFEDIKKHEYDYKYLKTVFIKWIPSIAEYAQAYDYDHEDLDQPACEIDMRYAFGYAAKCGSLMYTLANFAPDIHNRPEFKAWEITMKSLASCIVTANRGNITETTVLKCVLTLDRVYRDTEAIVDIMFEMIDFDKMHDSIFDIYDKYVEEHKMTDDEYENFKVTGGRQVMRMILFEYAVSLAGYQSALYMGKINNEQMSIIKKLIDELKDSFDNIPEDGDLKGPSGIVDTLSNVVTSLLQ